MEYLKQTILDLNGPILSFDNNPENTTVVTGFAATFTGIATATFPNIATNTGIITYRWYEVGIGALSDTSTITGTATTILTINPVRNPVDSGRSFYLNADYLPSAYGTVPITAGTARSTGNAINDTKNSNVAYLTVIPSLSITSQPGEVINASTENFARFNIVAVISDAKLNGSINYQWRLNGVNLSDDADTVGSRSNFLEIRRSEGTYSIDCVVSNPQTVPLSITSNSVTYKTENPRAIIVIERYDESNLSLVSKEQFDLRTNIVVNIIGKGMPAWPGQVDRQRGFAPPGVITCIYALERNVDIRVEMAGASGENYAGNQSGQGGYGVFRMTLELGIEYVFSLGSSDGSFGPSGGTLIGDIRGGVGGGGAFIYRGPQLIAAIGGGGGAGEFGAGGDGSGLGSTESEKGFGRNGGNGGRGGPSDDLNLTRDSFLTNSSTGAAAMRCLRGDPHFTNAGVSICDFYTTILSDTRSSGIGRYKANQLNLPQISGTASLRRGFKSGNSGRINGGRAQSGAGGGGGSGARGGDASSGNRCGGGGGSGWYDGGFITLLRSINGVNIGNAYANIKLFSAADPLPNPVIPTPPTFISVDWNNQAAPGYKIGRLGDSNQGCNYYDILKIGGTCGGSDYGYVQINPGTFTYGSTFSVGSSPPEFPWFGPDRNNQGSDNVSSVSYLEWSFELPDFGPVSRNKSGSSTTPNYDNFDRIRNGINPIFLKDAKKDEQQDDWNGPSCGDVASRLNEEAGANLYTCDEGAAWPGFAVGFLLQIIVPLDSRVLLADGTPANRQARHQFITRRYEMTFNSWDSRRGGSIFNERFVIPDAYLGCYMTPRLDFFKIEYIDDLALKARYPNDENRYRNVSRIEFDYLPEWNNRDGNNRNRRSRESNSVEFGRAIRR